MVNEEGENKMIKTIKRITVTIMALMLLATGVAFGAGYITWGGTSNYNQAMNNMDAIKQRAQEMKSDIDLANASNEQLQNIIRDKENVIRDKENVIRDKDNQITDKQNEINQLKEQKGSNDSQLKQAEIDMKAVKDKSQEVLDGMR